MFKLTIMTGHFASEASGPQKLQKYIQILRDLYASSLGKKTFLKVRKRHLTFKADIIYLKKIDSRSSFKK